MLATLSFLLGDREVDKHTLFRRLIAKHEPGQLR